MFICSGVQTDVLPSGLAAGKRRLVQMRQDDLQHANNVRLDGQILWQRIHDQETTTYFVKSLFISVADCQAISE